MPLHVLILATALHFEEYSLRVNDAFVASPQARAMIDARSGSEAGRQRILSDSPVHLGASANATWYQAPPPNYPLPQRARALGSTASIAYLPRSGFEATFSATYEHATLHNPSPFAPSPSKPFNLALDLKYDVLQGGPRSTAWLNAYAAAEEAGARTHGLAQQLLDARIGFVQLMTDIYAGTCRVGLLRSTRAEIDRTLKAAHLELEAGLLGQRDYFNFTTLESGFAAQQAQLEANLSLQKEQAHAYGSAAGQLSDELETTDELCAFDIEATEQLARRRVLSTSQLDDWASSLPSARAAKATLSSAENNFDAVEKGLRPSAAVLVDGQYGRPDFVNPPLYQVGVGVSVDWVVPGERGVHASTEAGMQLSAAREQVVDAKLQARATLSQLSAQLTHQVEVFEVLRKALGDSNQLLKVLEAQRVIGRVDSLNFATAYLNHVSLRQSALDAWAAVRKSALVLDIYQQTLRKPAERSP